MLFREPGCKARQAESHLPVCGACITVGRRKFCSRQGQSAGRLVPAHLFHAGQLLHPLLRTWHPARCACLAPQVLLLKRRWRGQTLLEGCFLVHSCSEEHPNPPAPLPGSLMRHPMLRRSSLYAHREFALQHQQYNLTECAHKDMVTHSS